MNWDIIKGNWNQLKGRLREEWADLTDDDHQYIAGQRDQFVGRLQEKYGYAKDEAERRVDDFARRHSDPNPVAPGATTDTRGLGERIADAITGDRVDDKTGRIVR